MGNLKEQHIEHINKKYEDLKPMSFGDCYYHDYFREIPFRKLKELLDSSNVDLNGRNIFVASCGNGIDIYYLKKYFDAEYFVGDISENALTVALKTFKGIKGQVADNEALPFEDDEFDYSYIAASLHHLSRPTKGLYELLRVAKKGVIVIEPNESPLVKLAMKLKLAKEYEESGNYVYRFSKEDVEKISKSLFGKSYIKRCFAIHRVAKSRFEFEILRFLNGLANCLIPWMGNTIIFYIEKRQENS